MSSTDSAARPPPRRRAALYAVFAILIGVSGTLLFLEIALRFLPMRDSMGTQPVTLNDPLLRFAPDRDLQYSVGWNFVIRNRVRVNRQGFVNDQDYDAGANTPLLAVIGDSYVEALMVPYRDTLHGRLAQLVGSRGRVYSFGASGAPLSQYLAYAKHARDRYHPNALAVVIVGNDFDESLIEYKSAPGFHYLSRTADGSFKLELVPWSGPSYLGRFARHSVLYRYLYLNLGLETLRDRLRGLSRPVAVDFVGNVPAQVDAERLTRSKLAADFFLNQLPRFAGLPEKEIALLVDGIRPNLYDPAQLVGASRSYYGKMREYVLFEARRRGYRAVDMQEQFIARHACDGARFEWDIDSHWNGTGHEEAMRAVLSSGLPERVFGPLPNPDPTICRSRHPAS